MLEVGGIRLSGGPPDEVRWPTKTLRLRRRDRDLLEAVLERRGMTFAAWVREKVNDDWRMEPATRTSRGRANLAWLARRLRYDTVLHAIESLRDRAEALCGEAEAHTAEASDLAYLAKRSTPADRVQGARSAEHEQHAWEKNVRARDYVESSNILARVLEEFQGHLRPPKEEQ